MSNIKWTNKKIQELANQQKQSGLSVRQFCKSISFNPNYFYQLKSKLKNVQSQKAKSSFVPVKLLSDSSQQKQAMKVKVFCFEFSDDFSSGDFKATMQAMINS